MNKHCLLISILGLCGFFLPIVGSAQTTSQAIKITYPESRAVFQRENDNTSTIYLSGNYYQPVDSIQARVIAEVVGQGFNTDWLPIQRRVRGGFFQGP